jgi:hypothetical protein
MQKHRNLNNLEEAPCAEIQSLISGKTGYVETGAASVTGTIGQAAIYWGADGSGLYKTPKGPIWHGNWSIKGNLYCSEYKEGPKRPCMKVEKQGDTVNFFDAESGQLRVPVISAAAAEPKMHVDASAAVMKRFNVRVSKS